MKRLFILGLLALFVAGTIGVTATFAQNRPHQRNDPPAEEQPAEEPDEPDEAPADGRTFSTVPEWEVGEQMRVTLLQSVTTTILTQGQEILQVQTIESVQVQTILAVDDANHVTRLSQRYDTFHITQETQGMLQEQEHPLLGHTLIYMVEDGTAYLEGVPDGLDPEVMAAVRELALRDGTPETVQLGQSWVVPAELTTQQLLQGMAGQGEVLEARQEMEFSAIEAEGEGEDLREVGVFTGTLAATMRVMGMDISTDTVIESRIDLANSRVLSSTTNGTMSGESDAMGFSLEGVLTTTQTHEYGSFPAPDEGD